MLKYIDFVDGKDSFLANIQVEYSVPCDGVMVVFYSKSDTNGLKSGKSSSNYDTYCIKRLNHIVTGSFEKDGDLFTIKLGFFFDEQYHLSSFVLKQQSTNGFVNFKLSIDEVDCAFDDFKLITLSDYNNFRRIINKEEISLSDYLTKLFSDGITLDDYTLYNLSIKVEKHFSKFLTKAGHEMFLESEEE